MSVLDNVTAQDVLAWARAQEPEAVIGLCGDGMRCLIAKYLWAYKGVEAYLFASEDRHAARVRYLNRAHRLIECPLPSDLNALALAFDALGHPRMPIRARDLDFAALEAAVAEGRDDTD